MPVSDDFAEYVREQLERVRPVTTRKMFGGLGIYAGGLFFAIVDDDILYFKVDDSNRADYLAAGMKAFAPMGPDRPSMGYFEVPERVLESVASLRVWMDKSLAVARARKGAGRKPARRKKT
jgi:DNA transformation protein